MEQMLNAGVFMKIPGFWDTTPDADINFQIFLKKRALNEKMTPDDWKYLKSLPTQRKNYVMNLFVLTHPIEINSWLRSQKRLTSDEKKVLYLAVLLEKKNAHFTLSENEMEIIKDLVDKTSSSSHNISNLILI
jgi:hypothetical protein